MKKTKYIVCGMLFAFLLLLQVQNTYAYSSQNTQRVRNAWYRSQSIWYYADAAGNNKTGWQEINHKWYYLDGRRSGAMVTGWQQSRGKWYYLGSSGAMRTGWCQVGNKWYYLNASGAMQTGWRQIGGKWYYLNSDGSMATGWCQVKGKWYYLYSNGTMATGWREIKGKWYYLNSQGVMQTGWFKPGSKWYYLGASGAMRTGWCQVGSKWYYFSSNGTMQTGWIKPGSKWYYLTGSGAMKTGWLKWKTDWYYLYSNGAMATNAWVEGYYLSAGGPVGTARWSNVSGTSRIYCSKTLHVDVQRKVEYSTIYWTAHVKTNSASQLRSALSNGTYGGTRQLTSRAVPANGGIVGVNGSAFNYGDGKPSPLGMCIKNGKIYGNYMTSYSVCAVKKDGTIYTPRQGLMGQDLLNAGVKDTYNFEPVLINNGIPQSSWAETNKKYPRTVVGMISPNNYVLLVCQGKGVNGSLGLNHSEMITILNRFGCKYAYNLDGGGSSTLYFDGKVLNNPSDGAERACADYLFFTN